MDPNDLGDIAAEHPEQCGCGQCAASLNEDEPKTPYQKAALELALGLDFLLRKIAGTDHGAAYAEAIAYEFGLLWARKPIDIAQQHGIHRQTLSTVVCEVADRFGIKALREVETRVQSSKSRFEYKKAKVRQSHTTARKNNAIIRRIGAACHVKGGPITIEELSAFRLSKTKVMAAAVSEGAANKIAATAGKVALKGGKKAWETCYRAIPPKSPDAKAVAAGAVALGKETG